jgi:hypothetical protein
METREGHMYKLVFFYLTCTEPSENRSSQAKRSSSSNELSIDHVQDIHDQTEKCRWILKNRLLSARSDRHPTLGSIKQQSVAFSPLVFMKSTRSPNFFIYNTYGPIFRKNMPCMNYRDQPPDFVLLRVLQQVLHEKHHHTAAQNIVIPSHEATNNSQKPLRTS